MVGTAICCASCSTVPSVSKWKWETAVEERLFDTGSRVPARPRTSWVTSSATGGRSCSWTAPDGQSLRLYTTTIPTGATRIYTLMHDPAIPVGHRVAERGL